MIGIDLGSNSMRICQMDCQTKEVKGFFSKTVRTADGLKSSGIISNEAIERIVLALEEATLAGIDFNDKIYAVTTQALRQANNKEEVIAKIYAKSGVKFEIIDGDKEAYLTLEAVKRRMEILALEPQPFLLLDIGGGSTEIIFVYDTVVITKSFPIGIVTLTQSFDSIEELKVNLPLKMQEMKIFIEEVYAKYGKVGQFLATAGTPTSVASMKLGMTYATYDAKIINGTLISKQDVLLQLERLMVMNHKQRVEVVGVGREDLIATGMLIYDTVFDFSSMQTSLVVDDGLVEGVLIESCKNS